jgi:hypothetical protein
MRIGLIQTRGIGDIIIALPIAEYLSNLGHEIIWPIDSKFLPSFTDAAPQIHFRPVMSEAGGDMASNSYFVNEPAAILRHERCETTLTLYSRFREPGVVRDPALAASLKFDEYKYAVAGVPFIEKWRLSIRRNTARERALYDRVAPTLPYACIHLEGSNVSISNDEVSALTGGLPVVRISPETNNIFDWLLVIEKAARLIMIDSCYSNLVEQLGFTTQKHLLLRSPCGSTPVYKNGWRFVPSRAAVAPNPPRSPPQSDTPTKNLLSINYSIKS